MAFDGGTWLVHSIFASGKEQEWNKAHTAKAVAKTATPEEADSLNKMNPANKILKFETARSAAQHNSLPIFVPPLFFWHHQFLSNIILLGIKLHWPF